MKKNLLLSLAIVTALSTASVSTYAEGNLLKLDESTIGISVGGAVPISLEGGEVSAVNSQYSSFRGVIQSIERDEERVVSYILATSEDGNMMRFVVSDSVLSFEGTEGNKIEVGNLEMGDIIVALYPPHTPMAMSYPPMLTPAILVQLSEEVFMNVEVNSFDESHLAYDSSLRLNISEETKIFDEEGNELTAEDIKNERLLVFYNITTRSIPPQTSPVKVYLLNIEETVIAAEKNEVVAGTEETVDLYLAEEDIMLPLASIAREYEYIVTWNEENRTVEVKNSVHTFILTIGSTRVEWNGIQVEMSREAEIIDNLTHVPSGFFNFFGEV